MLVHPRVTPSIKFAGTHLYTWVERGTVREKCLAQEHNTMYSARARTQSTPESSALTMHGATISVYRDIYTYLLGFRVSMSYSFGKSACVFMSICLVQKLSALNTFD